MLPYIRGERPVIVAANDFRDIREATEFADEFRLKLLVAGAAAAREPHRVTAFLERVAKEFHAWYQEVRILVEDAELAQARLALARGVQIAVREGLGLLGISAPQAM